MLCRKDTVSLLIIFPLQRKEVFVTNGVGACRDVIDSVSRTDLQQPVYRGLADMSIDSEIEKDILTSDRVYWIVSFIRWSGLRLFESCLRQFTASEGKLLKIITTTYMATTEPRAIQFLSELRNTEIKISYQTKIERLHAKAYIFKRDTGYDTAYIGSSNLSHSALTKGLEWNIQVTNHENPHIIEKAKASFDYYWNSIDFEDLHIGGMEKFNNALSLFGAGEIPFTQRKPPHEHRLGAR
jgi:HKD family nuclease